MGRKSHISVDSDELGLSPLVAQLVARDLGKAEGFKKPGRRVRVAADTILDEQQEQQFDSLSKSILNVLNGPKGSIERLAFEADPSYTNTYQALYHAKTRLVPDTILKRIAIQDDLVASIVQARCNQMSVFGRPREDRFATGFLIEPKKAISDRLSGAEKEQLQPRIDRALERFATCGSTSGWNDREQLTLSQWIVQSVRSAVVVGRLATEVIHVHDEAGERKFHSFRPIDAGTIYKAAPQEQAAQAVRAQARHLLEQVKNKRLEPERFARDEYAWVQVIEGRPVQAFTADECLVHNFYSVPDVELDGYPVTPIDTVISAVTTHLNIGTHNKLYFQSGRASRGMLIIKSDDVDENVIARIRQQFNASINNVNSSWRMPVFGIGQEDEIEWAPIDSGSRDMEWQYLADMNARVILSAFQMAPEELPGYGYLSRGTNNQSLSESNNEYLLEAARDLGIRPLLKHFEDFLNQRIFPLIDADLAKVCVIRLYGLDSETAEKESVRLQQDAPVHMTYNEILDKTEKKTIHRSMGGDVPLNPQLQAILDKYITVGQVQEYFLGVKDASKNPQFAYVRDPFWFQWQQLQMQMQQMQMQQQQAQAQAAQGGPPSGGGGGEQGPPQKGGGDGGGDESSGGGGQPQQTEKQKTKGAEESSGAGDAGTDLTRAADQAIHLLSRGEGDPLSLAVLSKGEDKLPPSKRRLLAQHRRVVDEFVKGWQEDSRHTIDDILSVVDKFTPKHRPSA